jgi:hypothetical protein
VWSVYLYFFLSQWWADKVTKIMQYEKYSVDDCTYIRIQQIDTILPKEKIIFLVFIRYENISAGENMLWTMNCDVYNNTAEFVLKWVVARNYITLFIHSYFLCSIYFIRCDHNHQLIIKWKVGCEVNLIRATKNMWIFALISYIVSKSYWMKRNGVKSTLLMRI